MLGNLNTVLVTDRAARRPAEQSKLIVYSAQSIHPPGPTPPYKADISHLTTQGERSSSDTHTEKGHRVSAVCL